jgi:hypothetical protein
VIPTKVISLRMVNNKKEETCAVEDHNPDNSKGDSAGS